MKTEYEIDAALKMLGQSQPPTGLTARVHRSLATAATKQPRTDWLVWAPVASAAMVAVLFAVALQIRSTPGKRANTTGGTAKMAVMDSAVSQPHHPAPVPSESVHKRNVSMPTAHRNSRTREPVPYRHAANLMSYPLTQQEKLLVEFAQHAKPEDLRDLNPEYQAKVEAQQEAEFAAYLKSGNSSDTENAAQTNDSSEE